MIRRACHIHFRYSELRLFGEWLPKMFHNHQVPADVAQETGGEPVAIRRYGELDHILSRKLEYAGRAAGSFVEQIGAAGMRGLVIKALGNRGRHAIMLARRVERD